MSPLDIELILAHVLKKSREYIIAHPEYELTKLQIAHYKLLIAKRLNGIPIAYITGKKEFYGLKFKVNKNVLIPRPETELMVEEALKLATQSSQRVILTDVGTGSGCVIIALAKQIANCLATPDLAKPDELHPPAGGTNYKFIATDISAKALAVARQNAKLHGVAKNIKFIKGNLLEPLTKILDSLPAFARTKGRGNDKKKKLSKSKFVILANLPYLTPTQIKNSPSIKHEPDLALSGGKNGLELYKKLFQQINCLIHDTKYKIQNTLFILCEIDPGQTAKIKQLVKRELPQATCQIKKDLFGLNRLVIIKII